MTSAKLFGLHPMAWVHAQEIIDQEMRMLKEGHGAKKRIRFLRDETNQVVRLSDVTLLDAFQSLIEDFNRDELIHNIDETRKRFEFYGFTGSLRSIRNAYRSIGFDDPGIDATIVPVAIQALNHDQQLTSLIQQTIESIVDILIEQPEFAHIGKEFESIPKELLLPSEIERRAVELVLKAFRNLNRANITFPPTSIRTIAYIRGRLLDVEMTDILSLIVTHAGITAISNILHASRETQLRTYEHVLTAVVQVRLSELDSPTIEQLGVQETTPTPQPQEPDSTLLTPKEAMKLLNISSTTLYRLRKSGALESVNVRGSVPISRVCVESYLSMTVETPRKLTTL